MQVPTSRDAWERGWRERAVHDLTRFIIGTEPARLLTLLWESGARGTTAAQAADSLYGTQHSSDPTARVRTAAAQLRNAISAFEHTPEGKRARFRISLENKPYRLGFTASDFAVKRFWQPHCSTRESFIVSTAPVFLRDLQRRTMIRQLDLNIEHDWDSVVKRWIDALDSVDATASELTAFKHTLKQLIVSTFETRRPYTPVGEMKCVFRLSQCFERVGIPVQHAFAHETALNTSHDYVLVGNARTNELLRAEQQRLKFDFMMSKTSVNVRQHRREDGADDAGHFTDRIWPGGEAFAAVTRTCEGGRSMTVLGANHSWAFATLGELLSSDAGVGRLLQEAQAPEWGELPDRFGVVLQMFLSRQATESVSQWRVATSRGLDRPR